MSIRHGSRRVVCTIYVGRRVVDTVLPRELVSANILISRSQVVASVVLNRTRSTREVLGLIEPTRRVYQNFTN